MPKILDLSKDKIMQAAAKILKDDGYAKLSVRKVAEKCGMATGTFYRYFESKDYLVAQIIATDWVSTYAKMHDAAKNAVSFEKGFLTFFRLTEEFTDRYRHVFKEYSEFVGSHETLLSRHSVLRAQIAACTRELALNTGQEHIAIAADMTAESLLAVINQPDLNEKSLTDFIKILTK